MNKIRVLIKRPDEDAGHITAISDTLENLQRTVDGYIETVTAADDIVIVCNEEGRLMGLPKNCRVKLPSGCSVDFVGTIIVAGTKGDELADLPDRITRQVWRDEWICEEG